jgi:hypothetical protein
MFKFTIVDNKLQVSGKTFDVKDELKRRGGKWNPKANVWELDVAHDTDELRDTLVEMGVKKKIETKAKEKAEREYANSPEGKKKAVLNALEIKKRTGQFYWVCCEECEVIDWIRGHTSCNVHAEDRGTYKDTFRIRGCIYTGD